MIPLVFLHGVGDGGISGARRTAIEQALKALGYPGLDGGQVIAQRYTALLKQEPSPSAPLPKYGGSQAAARGVLARGFARFRCDGCRHEILVAFSCKGVGTMPRTTELTVGRDSEL